MAIKTLHPLVRRLFGCTAFLEPHNTSGIPRFCEIAVRSKSHSNGEAPIFLQAHTVNEKVEE